MRIAKSTSTIFFSPPRQSNDRFWITEKKKKNNNNNRVLVACGGGLLFVLLLLFACLYPQHRPTHNTEKKVVISSDKMTTTTTTTSPLREIHDPTTGFTALVHVPPANPSGETEEVALPLLVYLHGAGESGNNVRDLISEGATGTPVVELEYKRALPILSSRFVMVAPQTNHGWRPEKVHQFLDFLLSGQQQHGLPNMDETRCYVTGHSMGGAGALYAAATRTRRRFAAVVPVLLRDPQHIQRI